MIGIVRALTSKVFPKVEEPRYQVERQLDGVEIRRYGEARVAETDVSGSYRESLYAGFRRLAGYIFGGNAGRRKIAMTAPVGAVEHDPQHWTVSFVMPSSLASGALPQPTDSRVRLRELPARRVAVLAFRGRANAPKMHQRIEELRARVERAGLRPSGEPQLSQYDPPWIPGPLRRNEVMIAVEAGS